MKPEEVSPNTKHDLTPDSISPEEVEALDPGATLPGVDATLLAKLENVRDTMALIVRGPSEQESLGNAVREALEQVQALFQNLPALVNRPDSPNTAMGIYDTDKPDSKTEADAPWIGKLKELGREIATESEIFKKRLHQLPLPGKQIVDLALEIEGGTTAETRSTLYRALVSDVHNAGKILDSFQELSGAIARGMSPAEAIETFLPTGLDGLLEQYPIQKFLDGAWGPAQLIDFFGCGDRTFNFSAELDPRFALVFAEPKLQESFARTAGRKGVNGSVSGSADFHNALMRSIILDATDIIIDNAADEIKRDGMSEKLLALGTAGHIQVRGSIADEQLVIEIKDNALGIAHSVIEKWGSGELVTTKTGGSDYQRTGTGQGLQQVLDIVHAEGGSLEIKTSRKDTPFTVLNRDATGDFSVAIVPQSRWPVHGTTFTLRLPLIKAGTTSGEF